MNNKIPEHVEEFAKAVCKIKQWDTGDDLYLALINAINKGMWNEQFSFWIAGRQSVLDDLKSRGHSMGDFVKSHDPNPFKGIK